MKIIRLIILLAVLTGCKHSKVVRSPISKECFPETEATPYSLKFCGSTYSSEEIGRYLKAFEDEWSDTFFLPKNPEKLNDAISNTVVMFQDHQFSSPLTESPSLLGLTITSETPFKILVFQSKTCHEIYCTVIGHELLHLGLFAITGDSKPDHFNGTRDWPQKYLDFLIRVNIRYEEETLGFKL